MLENLTGQNLLERYQVGQPLGSGGMADVYYAWDSNRNHAVALKFLKFQYTGDAQFFKRFWTEAQHLEQLRHDNIVRFLGFEQYKGRAFIVMAYIAGPALSQRLRNPAAGALSPEETSNMIAQIANALHYAHSENVMHLDVKPGNIILGQDGQAYLADLGIATAINRSTSSNTLSGTAAYMAPEQCQPGPVDHRADIYALGVVAYQALSNVKPFRGDTPNVPQNESTNNRIRWEQLYVLPVPIRQYRPELSQEAETVLARALDKNPDRRYQSVLDFSQNLIAALRQGRSQSPPTRLSSALPRRSEPEPAPPTRGQPPDQKRVSRAGCVITFLGVVVIAAILGIVLFSDPIIEVTPTGDTLIFGVDGSTVSPTVFVTSTRRPTRTTAEAVRTATMPTSITQEPDTQEPSIATIALSETVAIISTETPTQVETTPAPNTLIPTALPIDMSLPATLTPTTAISPTATPPSPTFTATPVTIQAVILPDEGVRLRDGPGTGYAVVGGQDQGDIVVLDGRTVDSGWLRVQLRSGNAHAWVRTDLVRIEEGDVADLPVVND